MKLGKRLKQIESMVSDSYDHIWDCCCDHGLLGASLLNRHPTTHIHFVDIVPELMQQLEKKLLRFFPHPAWQNTAPQWQMHCMDVTTLPLQEFKGKHLVIIAGVGGDLMVEFIKELHLRNPQTHIEFLLCPVHHQFAVRQQLIEYNFCLLTEALITENNRFYEAILVSNNIQPEMSRVSSTGSLLWQTHTPEQAAVAEAYLRSTLAHYQRMQLNPAIDVQHIIAAYSAIRIELSRR